MHSYWSATNITKDKHSKISKKSQFKTRNVVNNPRPKSLPATHKEYRTYPNNGFTRDEQNGIMKNI